MEQENNWELIVEYKIYIYISYKEVILLVSKIVKKLIKRATNLRQKAKSIYYFIMVEINKNKFV